MKDRTVLIGLLCAGTLCVGALQAQEANGAKGKPGRTPPHYAGSATNRFAAIDTNTNGVISLDEFKAMLAKREELIKQRMGDKYDAALAAKKPPMKRSSRSSTPTEMARSRSRRWMPNGYREAPGRPAVKAARSPRCPPQVQSLRDAKRTGSRGYRDPQSAARFPD